MPLALFACCLQWMSEESLMKQVRGHLSATMGEICLKRSISQNPFDVEGDASRRRFVRRTHARRGLCHRQGASQVSGPADGEFSDVSAHCKKAAPDRPEGRQRRLGAPMCEIPKHISPLVLHTSVAFVGVQVNGKEVVRLCISAPHDSRIFGAQR